MLRALLALLLAAAPVWAQEPPPERLERRPFRLRAPFRPGEVWVTATGARVRTAVADGAPFEASIAWTQSVLVLDRPQGFALRATITSAARERLGPDGAHVDLWRESASDWRDVASRTWTAEVDRDWTVRRMTAGPAAARLGDELLGILGARTRARRPWDRLRDRLEARPTDASEDALLALADRAGAPVRAVMAGLRAAPVAPGTTWRFGPRGGWPGGQVELLGVDAMDQGRFRIEWDQRAVGTLDGRFAIDPAGRLTFVTITETLTAGRGRWAVRTTRELVHGLVRLGAEPEADTAARSF